MKCRTSKDWQRHLPIRLPRDYPWKVASGLLEDLRCSLDEKEYQYASHILKTRDYDAYLALSEAWRPQSNNSMGCRTIENVRATYQVSAVLKKFRFPSDNGKRRNAAIKKFMAAEESCREFNDVGHTSLRFLWDSDELRAYTYARNFIAKLLGQLLPSHEQMTLWSRHGPGANLDSSQGHVSLYDKYETWPYSCTSCATGHARLAIQSDERWLGALEDSYRSRHGLPANVIIDQNEFWTNVFQVVNNNRITFVPKNAQTDRSIAIEPAMNLYLQLGVDGYIRRRLKRFGVDLDDQRKNQELARRGSQDWLGDDPFVTLDLAAASDSVSTELCKILLPPQWYHYLMDLRCPTGRLDTGETISYEKISSMGNGYTFALESLIFTALVYGVERVVRGRYEKENIAVFGDDLIVRRSSAPLLVRMLNLCGFSVNTEKSFLEGPFRESCGADWFKGAAVRPVFLEETPLLVPALWNDINRLQKFLWLHGYESTCKLPSWMDKWIPEMFRGFTGPCSDEDFYTYRHVAYPTVGYRRCLWEFNRLTLQNKPSKRGTNFLFRKLMATLRPGEDTNSLSYLLKNSRCRASFAPWSSRSWGRVKLAAAGSVFTVSDTKTVTVGVTPTQTSVWSAQYTM